MHEMLLAIERLPPIALLRVSGTLYPLVSGLHILGIGLLIGSIASFDLRMMGLAPARDWRTALRTVTPLSAFGLGLALLTGALLFAVRASVYINNPALLLKWLLIALGLLNVAVFYAMARRVPDTETAPPPLSVRIGAVMSLLIWTAAIFAGRWIAFAD
jgi:hypothetical protein